ncbi:metal-dependent transcriptional regulator [Halopiger xanaduensis]|uniref:Iron (Metal) dependent repressor, DtxR family n=1 Tax=Halopiger xanaduensis (strain DSM 18323 / JCM 14033 / SH-6) TaxID=797210 RepID=F8DAW3_HALXS|nr:metal-dependent transcriptional regulator [Halopiger xanaduensis]AEH38204.1 iron (metal) dependent repressor, DtxR family [Halopiger xanaduensis SH-6]
MTSEPQYLLVVYRASRNAGEPVSPGRVADELDRSPAATTEMLQRLETRGLLEYEPYEGATLTAEGRETAAELYETYVVLSQFFREVLDLEDPEAEALELAGSVSPLVTERVAETLLERDAAESIDGETVQSSLERS